MWIFDISELESLYIALKYDKDDYDNLKKLKLISESIFKLNKS